MGAVVDETLRLSQPRPVVAGVDESLLALGPALVFRQDLVEEASIVMWRDLRENETQRFPSIADDPEVDRGAPSDVAARRRSGSRLPTSGNSRDRGSRYDHQQEVGVAEGIGRSGIAEEPALPDVEGVAQSRNSFALSVATMGAFR